MNLTVVPIDMFLGWATNVIAIKMLTRPYVPRGVGPFKIQGLIPSRKAAFADGIATIIAGKLFTSEDLASTLGTAEMLADTKNKIADNILLKVDVPKQGGDNAKSVILKLLDEVFTGVNWEDKSEEAFPLKIHKVVKQKIIDMDISEIDELINSVSKSEFKFIERIGALVGLIIGLFQVLIC